MPCLAAEAEAFLATVAGGSEPPYAEGPAPAGARRVVREFRGQGGGGAKSSARPGAIQSPGQRQGRWWRLGRRQPARAAVCAAWLESDALTPVPLALCERANQHQARAELARLKGGGVERRCFTTSHG